MLPFKSNGPLERIHATIKDLIRTNMKEKGNEWDENLNLRTSVHKATGYTSGRKADVSSTIFTSPRITRKELFKLWKKRHGKYLQKSRYKRQQDS